MFISRIFWLTVTSLLINSVQDSVQESSTSSTRHEFIKPPVSPPRITILSHKLHEDTIDIPHGEELHLRCDGQNPMIWIIPNNNLGEEEQNLNITSNCVTASQCQTELSISNIQFWMTGSYVCQYNQTSKNGALNYPNQTLSVSEVNFHTIYFQSKDPLPTPLDPSAQAHLYIFVNDENNLVVPVNELHSVNYQFIAFFQSQPATIPCKPTISSAKVSLWKTLTRQGTEVEITPNASLGITYDPKKGFHFESPRWDSDSNILECRYEHDENRAVTTITLHWSVLPNEIHPLIDDSGAKHVFLNKSFSLRCFVHMDLGVIGFIDWDYPNKAEKTSRIVKSNSERTLTKIDNHSYDTVTLNLTVHNAVEADAGEYRCIATDGNGRLFSTVKQINVFDERLPPSINLTMMEKINSTRPLDFDVGEDFQVTFVAHAFPDISMFDLNWYHNDQPLNLNDSHYQVEIYSDTSTQITLAFYQAQASHSGRYTLVANSSTVRSNISVEILLSGEPEVVLDNVQTNYLANISLSMLCSAFSHPVGQVWWSWIDCNSSADCFDHARLDHRKIFSANDSRWQNLTQCSPDADDSPAHQFCTENILPSSSFKRSYLNQSMLFVRKPHRTGVLRCSAINRYEILKEYQTPFIVNEDHDGLFNIISSTDEPTIDDTITLTCRASIFQYSQVQWRSDTKSINQTIDNSSDFSVSSTIVFRNVQQNDSALYYCEAKKRNSNFTERRELYLAVKSVSLPTIVETNMKDDVIQKALHSQFGLRCYISGRPKPSLIWLRDGDEFETKDDSGVRIEDSGQRIVFTRLLSKDSGRYECHAKNRGGFVMKSAYLVIEDEGIPALSVNEIIIYLMLFILAIAILVISVFISRKLLQDRLRKREFEMFSLLMFENGQMEMFNPDMPLDEQIDLLPYDSRYEFPKEQLRLGRTLGQGAFGRVVKAEAIGIEAEDVVKTVAVKMLKERANADHRKALMAELKILIHLGRNVNIVNLLGAVTRNIAKGELLVIVEYCEFGNLRDFLLANRENFTNELHPMCHGEYQNVAPPNAHQEQEYQNSWKNADNTAVSFSNHNYIGGTASVAISNASVKKTAKPLYSSDLICYSFQCSRGMEYLTQRKLIHRDLAARNVLLDSNYVVKICDFGLAKDVYRDDNYVKQNSGPLPIKWMAIESMTDKIFTSKSDVWSFGILLWEIFNLGKNPYPGIEINEEFYLRLKAGYRMERPDYASDTLYALMLKCWDPSPAMRPDFAELSEQIGQMMTPERREFFIELNRECAEMNEQLLRNDYMKMASVTDLPFELATSHNDDDYLQMHDDNKNSIGFSSKDHELIKLQDMSNNNLNTLKTSEFRDFATTTQQTLL